MAIAHDHLRIAKERQKKYADNKHQPKSFEVGEKVMLKVSPWKWIIRFGKREKLGPRFIGPFKVLQRIGNQTYKLELPAELDGIHNVFHVWYLRKCLYEELSVLPLVELRIYEYKRLFEEPEIIARGTKQLRKKMVKLVKVLWKNRHSSDMTWEVEINLTGGEL